MGLSTGNNPVVGKVMRSMLTQYPIVLKNKCIGCGVCRDSCPQKAITITSQGKKQAVIDAKHCIRCYCCHELCPHEAVTVKKNPIARLFKI